MSTTCISARLPRIPVAESWPAAKEKEFVVVQSRDNFKSKITKDSRDQYSWHVSSSQWALKHDATDEEDLVIAKEQVFQWRRMTSPEGTKASFVSPNWKLRDRNTEVHAVFIENWDTSIERGQLQFRRSCGSEWEMGVLLSVGIVAEGERRRRDNRGSSYCTRRTTHPMLCAIPGALSQDLNREDKISERAPGIRNPRFLIH
jgi:hypothetical protein